MSDNPWERLPAKPPYVLPEDEQKAQEFNFKARQNGWEKRELDLHFIPEPFVGRKEAPVVLLGKNPGFRNQEAAAHRKEPAFADIMRSNLMHRLSEESPFLYLDPEPHISPPGYSW